MHTRLGLLTLRQRTSGGGTAAPGPMVTNVSAAGTVPLVLSISDPNASVQDEGARIQWEFAGSLSPAKNADGSYTTTTQKGVSFVDGASVGNLDEAIGFNNPSGAFAFHFRILVDNESGVTSVTDQLGQTNTYTVGSWSNDYTDTISGSVAVLNSATGTNKSKYLNVASPFYQWIHNNNVGAACLVRAIIAAQNTKFHMEQSVDGIFSTPPGTYFFGIGDATIDLNAGGTGFVSTAGLPGSTGANAGFTLLAFSNSTSATLYYNGAAHSITLPANPAVGDVFGYDVDQSGNTFTFYHKHGASTTTVASGVALTSQIPAASNWYAFGGGEKGTGVLATSDAGTFNPGSSAFAITPGTGFNNNYG